MPTHSIYSVRDKKKVDAEVIDVREVSGAKGVRYQIVGRHPEDGTTVTTFCSAAVAEDYRSQLGDTAQHAAESVEVAEDNIPEPEAPVVATDGTPIDDDLDTFVEDPLIGSASEGTLTSAKVLAAEGESGKKNCGCGQDPCKTYGAEEVSEDTGSKFEETATGSIGVTVNGDWAGPGDEGKKMAIEIKLDPYQYHMMGDLSGTSTNTAQGWFEEIVNEGRKPKEVIDEYITGWAGDDWRKALDEGTSGFAAETVAGVEVQTPSQIIIETPDSDELIVPDPDLLVNGDGRVLGQQTGKVNTTPLHAESNFDNPDVRTFKPQEALEYLRSGDNTVWLIDYSDHNYGDDEYPHYDYPIEDPDELSAMIEDGVFEDHEQFGEIVIANDTSYALGMWKDQPGGKHPSYAEFDAESPVFARNKRILVPTAVIGGLALAYLAKPELLSGSFDRISDMLGKLTKKGDKTE